MKLEDRFIGKWKIDEMETWDQEFVNLVSQGFIEFDADMHGYMHFGCIEMNLDCHIDSSSKTPKLDFSFEGSDEGDPVNGRGWVIIENQKINGHIHFHMGDQSGFKASKIN